MVGWSPMGAGVVRDTLDGASAGATLSGSVRIIDGDTLEDRGTRVRLHGIDAPESAQRCRSGGRLWSCGRDTARALARRIGLRPVACEACDRDGYGSKELAFRLAARYGPTGWYAPSGVELTAFRQHGWLRPEQVITQKDWGQRLTLAWTRE